MTTLPDRPNTALLVIDVQNGVVAGAPRSRRKWSPTSARSSTGHTPRRFPSSGCSTTTTTSPATARPGIRAGAGPRRLGASRSQDLRRLLRGHRFGGAARRAWCRPAHRPGAQSDACVRSTIHGAFIRGYDVTLVGDAHTTEDLSDYGAPPPEKVIAHTNLYWQEQSAPGRSAANVDSAEVSFAGGDAREVYDTGRGSAGLRPRLGGGGGLQTCRLVPR